MAQKYDLPPQPLPVKRGVATTYGGALFRSLLEAQWAAFFDLLRWPWDYEPRGLRAYIPDFRLPFHRSLIAEVKPVDTVDGLRQYAPKIQASGWSGDFILLGMGFLEERNPDSYSFLTLGLMSQRVHYPDGTIDWQLGRALFHRCFLCGRYSFHHEDGSWRCAVGGCYDGDHFLGHIDQEEAVRLWRVAGNKVQWRAPSKRGE